MRAHAGAALAADVAFRQGAVPEVIDHGVSGFIVEDIDEAIQAVKAVGTLSRAATRKCFERRYTAERMAQDYVGLYRRLPGVCRQIAIAPRLTDVKLSLAETG